MHHQNIKKVKSLVDMKQLEESLKPKFTLAKNIFRYGCMIILASTVLSSCSTHRINRLKNKSYKEWKTFQWTEVKRSSVVEAIAWTIYSRKVIGTNLREYKIEGDIGASPESCVSEFRQEIQEQANSLDNKKYPTYEIVSESSDSLLTYVVHNEPFPLKDTEMLVQYVFSASNDGSQEVKWKESWNEYPIEVSKKLNRVEIFRGSWQFEKVSEKHSHATNIVQFDPKGMPRWLFQPMVLNFLRKGLENLRVKTTN